MTDIFSRIEEAWAKSQHDEAASEAEALWACLDRRLSDLREPLIQTKKQVVVALVDEKRLKKQLDKELSLSRAWEKKAMMAVRAGRDDLARAALTRKAEHDSLAQEFQAQWEMQKEHAERLRELLRRIDAKIEEAKRTRDRFTPAPTDAEARAAMQAALESLGRPIQADLSLLEMAVRRREARAQASADSSLGQAKRLGDVPLGDDVSLGDALIAIKAKMGATLSSTEAQREAHLAALGLSKSAWETEEF